MTDLEAHALLEDFRNNQAQQVSLAIALDTLAKLCAANARLHGFHEDEKFLRDWVDLTLPRFTEEDNKPVPQAWINKNLEWFDSQILQAELARQASEIGEAVEAVRKPGPDPHCPDFSNFLIEEADCVIRIGDTCGKRELPFGRAIVAKLLYNLGREWKHNKNS